ncbi:MAG: hypothetical protein IJ567_01645 [Lachnospiraceae bacterium]|nr:hypothetical protein [Lachnospiraceae bacterium]
MHSGLCRTRPARRVEGENLPLLDETGAPNVQSAQKKEKYRKKYSKNKNVKKGYPQEKKEEPRKNELCTELFTLSTKERIKKDRFLREKQTNVL